jgi:galactokinase
VDHLSVDRIESSAPGRVNLVGEHTDYNGGFVLPIAIPQRARVTLVPHSRLDVSVWSREFSGDHPFEYRLGQEAARGDWTDYVQGATLLLSQRTPLPHGFEARIESDVPPGSGLASSAALTVALLRGLRTLFGLAIDEIDLARLARAVETDVVGAPVGVMDQIAACFAEERRALLLDTRSLRWDHVALPDAAGLVVVDSGIRHRHAAGDYRARRIECQRAAELLGVAELRDVENGDRLARLPAPLDRRARHVVSENARVPAVAAALRRGDLGRAGALFDESHASMRDDFEISVAEVDALVDLARRQPGVHGARLTGGGFGGCIVALADRSRAADAARAACADYVSRTGRPGRVILPRDSPIPNPQ